MQPTGQEKEGSTVCQAHPRKVHWNSKGSMQGEDGV